MKKTKLLYMTYGAVIAALYVALTFIANALGIASSMIQVRFSEALCILPYFTSAAVPGLFVGCLIANLLTGCAFLDVVFGSLATLIGATLSYALRKRKWLVPVPAIVANAVIIPFVLKFVYELEDGLPFLFLTVSAGEIISCGVLGLLFLQMLERYNIIKKQA